MLTGMETIYQMRNSAMAFTAESIRYWERRLDAAQERVTEAIICHQLDDYQNARLERNEAAKWYQTYRDQQRDASEVYEQAWQFDARFFPEELAAIE